MAFARLSLGFFSGRLFLARFLAWVLFFFKNFSAFAIFPISSRRPIFGVPILILSSARARITLVTLLIGPANPRPHRTEKANPTAIAVDAVSNPSWRVQATVEVMDPTTPR